MSVVKDVDLEAMPTSIFLNDDDDYEITQYKRCSESNVRHHKVEHTMTWLSLYISKFAHQSTNIYIIVFY